MQGCILFRISLKGEPFQVIWEGFQVVGMGKAKSLLKKQNDQVEKEINDIKGMKHGNVVKVFKMVNKIKGSKGKIQEASALIDPITGDLIVDTKGIKEASLKYCLDNLKNNKPDKEFEREVEVVHLIHDKRMQDGVVSNVSFEFKDFEAVINRLNKNKKQTYNFLLRGGLKFMKSIFIMCKNMIMREKFPEPFNETILHQIFKGVGMQQVLNNNRYIHCKTWLPKTCDFLVIDQMKSVIVEKTSTFQVGGIIKHRPQEHIFTLKSVIAAQLHQNKDVIFQIYDIKRYFDKENLRDALNNLHRAGIDPKLYRLWYKLNQNTKIKVKTPVGLSDEGGVGECIGQGSGGGAIVSAINLDMDMEDFFRHSKDEMCYGSIRLQPLQFQDDIGRLVGGIPAAQAGNKKFRQMSGVKQLKFHSIKTGMIIFSKIRHTLENYLIKNPVRLGEFITKPKVMDKYLGDWIHQDGLGQSVEETITKRLPLIKHAIFEVVGLIEDFRMQALGAARCAIEIYEKAIVSSLLNNAETWMEISEASITRISNIQYLFLRLLFRVGKGTPKAALLSQSCLLGMKQRIYMRKLTFINALKHMNSDTLAYQILMEQIKMGYPGLAKECKDMCLELGLEDITIIEVSVPQWKKMVKEAVWLQHTNEVGMMMTPKCENIVDDDYRVLPSYISSMSLTNARMAFRIKSKMIDLKVYYKGNMRYKADGYICGECNVSVETITHCLTCLGYTEERMNRNLNNLDDLVQFFIDVMKKRSEKLK